MIEKAVMGEYQGEDQIFDYLLNKQADAVYLHFYSPGHKTALDFYNTFERESSNPLWKDKIIFLNVHCRKHLSFCANKSFVGRVVPMAELYYLNEKD